jgi:hypothetical protein
MRRATIVLITLTVMFASALAAGAQTSARLGTSGPKRTQPAAEPPVQSGIYGFSGGKVPGADFPEGVIGECIWVFDQHNHNQITKGDCSEQRPGQFRVVLKPGHYVVRGPGGNKPIEVRAGQWIKLESVTMLPKGP